MSLFHRPTQRPVRYSFVVRLQCALHSVSVRSMRTWWRASSCPWLLSATLRLEAATTRGCGILPQNRGCGILPQSRWLRLHRFMCQLLESEPLAHFGIVLAIRSSRKKNLPATSATAHLDRTRNGPPIPRPGRHDRPPATSSHTRFRS